MRELAELAATIERHTPADGGFDTPVPGLFVSRSSRPTDLTAVVYEPSLCVAAQGSKEVTLAGKTYRYDPAQSLLVSVDLPVAARVVEASEARPCLVVRVSLDLAVVRELLADDATGGPTGSSDRGLALAPTGPRLLGAVGRLAALLDTPGDVRALGPLVLREITYLVLTGPRGGQLRQIAAAGAPAHRASRAVRWLRENVDAPLRVEALARRVQMSTSAFHIHFKKLTGMSPLQYQKQIRLQEARRLMLGEGLDAAGAAFRVGYESPSQFSREYRRAFGSSPRRDVAALLIDARSAGRVDG